MKDSLLDNPLRVQATPPATPLHYPRSQAPAWECTPEKLCFERACKTPLPFAILLPMRSRYRFHEPDAAYFLTCTIVEWISVFQSRPYFDSIATSLAFCRRQKGLRLYAYVIMENHLHLIASAPDLSAVVQSFKSFTAREIVRIAASGGQTPLLSQFTAYKKRYKMESAHQVWQEGTHPQRIQGDEMLNQKVDYVHNNPVRRGYVDLPEHWRYSSARNYYLDDHSVMEIDSLHT
ncbi:MAG: hypothetical protein AMXMBFR84_03090 [Candidatus Hydrogenedentota bacterium]